MNESISREWVGENNRPNCKGRKNHKWMPVDRYGDQACSICHSVRYVASYGGMYEYLVAK